MAREQPFVDHLESLRENRGALAALRRGLGRSPGEAREMYPYVVPWVPGDASREREAVYYTIASLYAYHPMTGGSGNMGTHFARTVPRGGDHAAVERRFSVLLTAHRDDLPFQLRQAIGFLRSKEVPVDWHQLFTDLTAWTHPDGYVQKQWARAFWGRAADRASDEKED